MDKGYKYILKHGFGPGTLPKDVDILRYVDLDDGRTVVYLNRFLTSNELDYYDIPSETTLSEGLSNTSCVFESLTDDDIVKLSKYSELEGHDITPYLLDLLELVDDSNKDKVFEIFDAIYNTVNSEPEKATKSECYTQRLLGDI